MPEPNTWREILDTLDKNQRKAPIKNKRVALQEYGVSNPALVQGLKERGAQLLLVPVYRWVLPDDLNPLKKAIQLLKEGQIQVTLFTTAVQVDHVFKVAEEMGIDKKTLQNAFSKTVIASVGPDCSEHLKSYGLLPDIQPESPKMGPLVRETAEKAKTLLKKRLSSRGTCLPAGRQSDEAI